MVVCYAESMMTMVEKWFVILPIWDVFMRRIQTEFATMSAPDFQSLRLLYFVHEKLSAAFIVSMLPKTANRQYQQHVVFYIQWMQSLSFCILLWLREKFDKSWNVWPALWNFISDDSHVYTSGIYNTLKWQLKFNVLMIHKISFNTLYTCV